PRRGPRDLAGAPREPRFGSRRGEDRHGRRSRGRPQGAPASRVQDRSAQSGSSRRGSSAVTEPSGTRSRVYVETAPAPSAAGPTLHNSPVVGPWPVRHVSSSHAPAPRTLIATYSPSGTHSP